MPEATETVNIWASLAIQFAVITPMVWASVEFLSPSGRIARRVALVLYSWIFSFVAYLIGAVQIPDLVPRFDGLLWAQVMVVLALGLGTAALAHTGHELLPAQRAKKKE